MPVNRTGSPQVDQKSVNWHGRGKLTRSQNQEFTFTMFHDVTKYNNFIIIHSNTVSESNKTGNFVDTIVHVS